MDIDENNNCENCRYSNELEITPDLKRNIQCILNPPVPLGVATQQGLQVMCVFPVVNAHMICAQFDMKPTIIN